jgi:hypothetical protein
MKTIRKQVLGIIGLSIILTGAALDQDISCEKQIWTVSNIMMIEFYDFQVKQMAIAYQSKDTSTGIVIMENWIDWLENLSVNVKPNDFFTKDSHLKEMAISYVRLGNLHRKAGRQDKYESLLTQGVDLYNSTCDGSCKKITKEKMIWLVKEMDKSIPVP